MSFLDCPPLCTNPFFDLEVTKLWGGGELLNCIHTKYVDRLALPTRREYEQSLAALMYSFILFMTGTHKFLGVVAV